MKLYSYTRTPQLTDQLYQIDELHKQLLLTQFSITQKNFLRWNATINRIYSVFGLVGHDVDKSELKKIVYQSTYSRLSPRLQEVLRFKRAVDYLTYNWIANPALVSTQDLSALYEIATGSTLSTNDEELENSLKYLQTHPEHPCIQAASAHALIVSSNLFGTASNVCGFLTSMLFLFKSGYDFRRFTCLEEYYYLHRDKFHNLIILTMKDNNITPWLEFVTEAAESQLQKLLHSTRSKLQDYGTLKLNINSRQQQILNHLDQPSSKIGNKQVQKLFNVSAITAARDLTGLAGMGLVLPIGKGRSTFYTKS